MKIAFVACSRDHTRFLEDPSFVYRCQNPALALREMGHRVSLIHLLQLDGKQRYDLMVVHRPRMGWRFRYALRTMRRSAVLLLADVDDLIFHEAHAQHSPAVRNGLRSEAEVRGQFQANRRALERFDRFSVSTLALAEHMGQQFPHAQVHVLENCVHHSWIDLPPDGREASSPRTLTYFPGTRSHDRDFQVIEPVLAEFLDQEPGVCLEITGHLRTEIRARPGQLIRRDRLPFADYVRRVQGSWVNLSPLEDTPFNACKSALKVLEAGYWGAPTLTSPTGDALRFSHAGAILCGDREEWLDALVTLLDPAQFQRRISGLREKTLAAAEIRATSARLLDLALRA